MIIKTNGITKIEPNKVTRGYYQIKLDCDISKHQADELFDEIIEIFGYDFISQKMSEHGFEIVK